MGQFLEAERAKVRWNKISLLVISLVALGHYVLVGLFWWDGWRATDTLYAVSAVAWSGFIVVQVQILRRRQQRLKRLGDL